MPKIGPSIDAAPATSGTITIGPDDGGRTVTAAEFASARFAPPWTFERTGGRVQVMSPEGKDHVRASTPWLNRLISYAVAHPDRIQAVVPNAWVRIDPNNDRVSDIGVYLGGHLDDLNLPDQIPDLIFEFVGQSRQDRHRDYVTKRAEYQRIAVPEYVIVDRFDRTVTVLKLTPNGYAEQVITEEGTYESDLLPGFAVPLAQIWPR